MENPLQPSGFDKLISDRIYARLRDILEKFEKIDLLDVTYSVVKELIINATKALTKRIVFAENGLSIDDPVQWEKGTGVFKDKLSEEHLKEYLDKGKTLNFKIKLRYVYDTTGMRIEVVNNTPIPKIDEARMREKLAKAMKYEAIADYYMDNADNLEGSGMGLAFIIIMLRNQGIDPQYLRIGNDGDSTVARIEIPFTEEYVPHREKKHMERAQQDSIEL